DTRKHIDLKSQFKKVEIGIKNGVFVFVGDLTIDEFSKKIAKPASEIIKYFFLKGIVCNLNTSLNEEQVGEICLEYGYDFKKEIQIDEDNFLENLNFKDDDKELEKRPPIVTVMGHVDHGKTSVLDSIRKTRVVDLESGGITQKIGAYQVQWKNHLITFFDTPGHEAFSQMRARGADLTDIVILVVAADDGLKPQTEEAIDHALSAKVPIIVFINKMDKPNVNVEKILSQLAEKNVLCEEWGGKTIVVKGSAINNQGIDELLEAVILTAELMNLKANKNRLANGVTIEAYLDKGKGPVANLLVQNGTLMINDYILVGNAYGKIRKMIDDNGKELKTASPSTPVKIAGLNSVPNAGDKWIVAKDEKTIKELASKREYSARKRSNISHSSSTNSNGNTKELSILLKVDVNGSLNAVKNVLDSIQVDGIKLNIIRASVGNVSESDINLAKATKAKIYTFNLKNSSKILDYALAVDVSVKNYNLIYEIEKDVEKILKGTLDPVYVENQLGSVEIRQLWQHSSVGTIAGCRVLEGEIKRNALARMKRKNELIFENEKITSLKHGKDSITSSSVGKECGFTLENFNALEVGDIVEIYEMVEQVNE
ncbi:MAG: translation initiation factor IF-2, partial [Malacoplasma sp.]|nr:translation initiation factor IF-2 [Malacoplasma sp.]